MPDRFDVATAAVLDDLRRLVRWVRAGSQRAESVFGVSGAQLFVLERLAWGPAASLNELAARTLTHKSSVSVVVRGLVERGLVRRTRSRDDGRGVVLTLTAAGRGVLDRAPDSPQAKLIGALGRMGARERRELSDRLAQLVTALGARGLAPDMMFTPHGPRRRLPRRVVTLTGRS